MEVTASGTAVMLPGPAAPETAAVSAWKWLTSPVGPFSSYLPRTTSTASLNVRSRTRPNQPVKKRPATTMSGRSAPPTGGGVEDGFSQPRGYGFGESADCFVHGWATESSDTVATSVTLVGRAGVSRLVERSLDERRCPVAGPGVHGCGPGL